MSKISRSSIVGFHNIKNKVSRNAFDLSHRHLFTAQIGELLPIFCQWVNPNETFKIGYNGFSRTQSLQTAAFTRLKENVQYYFVPFQSLWKYFEQQVNNMTKGQSGENISRIASSATTNSAITTSMPFINYDSLRVIFDSWLLAVTNDFVSVWNQSGNKTKTTLNTFLTTTLSKKHFRYGTLRYSSAAKLLRALGYMNTDADTYDVASSILAYGQTLSDSATMTASAFMSSKFGWSRYINSGDVENAPSLSIFPLLAYHKIINDHYLYRQWQPYKAYTCNIDYLLPSDSMNFVSQLGSVPYDSELFNMGYSNLPLDYFNGVLPNAQYGDESAVSVDLKGSVTTSVGVPQNYSGGAVTSVAPSVSPSNITVDSNKALHIGSGSTASVAQIQQSHRHAATSSLSNVDCDLKISALRSAIALQKYREIQESNDSDFASQVLAHFGIKPKHDDYKSIFIGGGDSVIDINPQVNQNLVDDNDPTIKATGAGQLSASCKFTSDTYGIIIGIYRCVPQLDMAHTGIDRNLFKTDASDFPIPELDNLGMQTQYRCELYAPKICAKTDNNPNVSRTFTVDMSKTYGYLPRYAELKTSYDRFEGAFLDSLSSWVSGLDVSRLSSWAYNVPSNGSITYPEISDLLVADPSLCYPLFLDQTSNTANNDKILVGSVNSCIAVRPFSVYGLPYSK